MLKIIRRGVLATLALAVCGFASPSFAEYPEEPLDYIIAFNPGGESDLSARFQLKALEKYFGQNVAIRYKPGGGGSVAWSQLVNRVEPDGYTIAGINLPHIIVQPMVRGNAGYETLEIKPVYIFENTPNLLVIRADSPYDTLKEFLDYVRKQPPGSVTIGGSGSPSANSLGVALLEQKADVNLTYIPFTGTGAAVPALLGGHVTALMTYSTMGVKYKDKFLPLAIASKERMDVLPDVPTFKELGYDIVGGAYRGVGVPPGTPDDRVQYLAKTLDKVMHDPEVQKRMENYGFKLLYLGPEESTKLIKNKMDQNKQLLKNLGLLK